MLFSACVIPGINSNININYIQESKLEIINNLGIKINQIPNNIGDINSWPMFHHDLENTGYSNSIAPDADVLKWSFSLGNSVSSPVVTNDKVYVGESMGKMYCLDAESGNEIWSYISDSGIYFSAPAIYDGKVYIQTADEFICLDANTGDFIWSYSPCGGWSSPAVIEGKVYFGSDNNNVYCLNAYTGDKIWNYQTGGKVKSSPAVVNGKVFIGSDDNYVYCLNANSGSKIWSFLTGNLVESSPAVVNGKVYIGSADAYMYCIDAETGDEIWSYAPCCVKISSPAIAYGKVYAGTTCEASVYCLNAETGEKLWRFQTGGHVWSAPAVADGKVYVGSLDSKIYCLFAETGIEIWNYQTGGNVITSPAIADEKLYISSNNGKIYCFTSENQPPVPLFDWEPEYPEPGEIVTFDASDSFDTDGTIVLYEWDWDNDGAYDESHTTSTATHVWYEVSLYPVTLRVTDDDGATDTKTKIVFVGIMPPVADFTWTPEIPEPDETVTFDASDSYDADGTIVLYEWDWDNDGTYDESYIIPTAEHSWPEEGSYTVKLRVTDDDDLTDTCKKVIHIGVIPPIADFSWSPQVPQSGKVVTFDASGSYDLDGFIELYEWDWDNDGTYDESSTVHITQHTWFETGNYPVTLKVTDNSNAYDTVTNIIHVINRAPIGDFKWTPAYPLPGEIVIFDASGSYDPDGVIVLYEWDWDNDGTFDESSTTPVATRSWEEKGSYYITLRVTDNNEKIDRVTRTVKVSGEIITEANWGDSNFSGDPAGSFLTYKLQKWHGYESSNNKAWSQVDLNVWFPKFRKNVFNKMDNTDPFPKIRSINLPIIQKFTNFFLKIISKPIQRSNQNVHTLKFEENVKLNKAGRQGLSWASVGITYTPSNTGDTQITLKGKLKGKFTTDIITGSKVDNWVTASLHVVEKDSYIPEENEGESCELFYYNFTSNKKTIDVALNKGFIVSLSEGKEYLIYLKLKTYASLSPKRPILDGFFSSSAFGNKASDVRGAEFSLIGIQFL